MCIFVIYLLYIPNRIHHKDKCLYWEYINSIYNTSRFLFLSIAEGYLNVFKHTGLPNSVLVCYSEMSAI